MKTIVINFGDTNTGNTYDTIIVKTDKTEEELQEIANKEGEKEDYSYYTLIETFKNNGVEEVDYDGTYYIDF